MEKIKLSTREFVYPMPTVLVGSVVKKQPNFMAVAWVSRVNGRPPMLAVALGPHFTNQGIEENGAFSVNIPGTELVEKTDYCGIVSGRKKDKSKLFDVFYGEVEGAPLIKECPMCLACKVYDVVKLPTNTLFVGEIIAVYSEERYLTDGKPDIKKMAPFSLSMPDNHYWALGDSVGKAWHIGKKLIE